MSHKSEKNTFLSLEDERYRFLRNVENHYQATQRHIQFPAIKQMLQVQSYIVKWHRLAIVNDECLRIWKETLWMRFMTQPKDTEKSLETFQWEYSN